MSDNSKLVSDVHELPWFQDVLDQSQAFLDSLPEDAQPTWYRHRKNTMTEDELEELKEFRALKGYIQYGVAAKNDKTGALTAHREMPAYTYNEVERFITRMNTTPDERMEGYTYVAVARAAYVSPWSFLEKSVI